MKKSRKISKANIGSYDRARKGCIVIRVPDLAAWFIEYCQRNNVTGSGRYVVGVEVSK